MGTGRFVVRARATLQDRAIEPGGRADATGQKPMAASIMMPSKKPPRRMFAAG